MWEAKVVAVAQAAEMNWNHEVNPDRGALIIFKTIKDVKELIYADDIPLKAICCHNWLQVHHVYIDTVR